MHFDSLLSQPWQIQLALASGYAAYLVAFAGLRQNHQAIDVAFASIVFSVVATGLLAASPLIGDFPAGLLAITGTIVFGAAWRKWGRNALREIIRVTGVSWTYDDPSALSTLQANSTHKITQAAVQVLDGTWLRCDEAFQFRDSPFEPFNWGPHGDVALYLTHIESPEGEVSELTTVTDPRWGDRITYIPASQVKRVTIRYAKQAQ